jgi:hypothetical protein
LYILLKTLGDKDPEFERKLSNHEDDVEDDEELLLYEYAFDFYGKNTRRIEILFKDNKLIRVYFAVPPVCKHLSD